MTGVFDIICQSTILTTYIGQLLTLKAMILSNAQLCNGLRISSVDNYQGEENYIAIPVCPWYVPTISFLFDQIKGTSAKGVKYITPLKQRNVSLWVKSCEPIKASLLCIPICLSTHSCRHEATSTALPLLGL